MPAFKSRMITSRRKKAVDWTGPLDKSNHREDRSNAKQVAVELAQMVPQMLKKIPAKGVNLYEYVHQHGGLRGLIGQTDPELKKAYYAFRAKLDELLKNTEPSVLNQFYQEYGKNPLDWNFIKTSSRKMAMQKLAAFSDKIVDVPIGEMRNAFESDFSGDERSSKTDHKEDKFVEENLSKNDSKTAAVKLSKHQMTCPKCSAIYFDNDNKDFGCPNCDDTFTPAPKDASMDVTAAGTNFKFKDLAAKCLEGHDYSTEVTDWLLCLVRGYVDADLTKSILDAEDTSMSDDLPELIHAVCEDLGI